jgi:hypothetical protein
MKMKLWSLYSIYFCFYGMHPVVYLLDNIYLPIRQSTQQLLQ